MELLLFQNQPPESTSGHGGDKDPLIQRGLQVRFQQSTHIFYFSSQGTIIYQAMPKTSDGQNILIICFPHASQYGEQAYCILLSLSKIPIAFLSSLILAPNLFSFSPMFLCVFLTVCTIKINVLAHMHENTDTQRQNW